MSFVTWWLVNQLMVSINQLETIHQKTTALTCKMAKLQNHILLKLQYAEKGVLGWQQPNNQQ